MKLIHSAAALAMLATLSACIVDDTGVGPLGPSGLGASDAPSPGAPAVGPAARPGASPTAPRASARPTGTRSAEPGEEPTDDPGEDPTDDPGEGPTDGPGDDPTEDPAPGSSDDPAAQPGGTAAGIPGAGRPTVQVLAGASCLGKSLGDDCFADGEGAAARFETPEDVAIAPDGTIYVADTFSHAIRKVTPDGTVTTIAGAGGEAGLRDGLGGQARFSFPNSLTLDGVGNLVIREGSGGNNTIRVLQTSGKVTTLAGRGELASGATASLIPSEPAKVRLGGREGIVLIGNKAFVADAEDDRIVKMTIGGGVEVFAGGGESGRVDGQGADARFNDPAGLAVDRAGNIFVADYGNDAIRKITPDGVVTTVLSGGSSDALYHPVGLAFDGAGNLYISDSSAIFAMGEGATFGRIQRLAPDGTVTTVFDSSLPDAAGRKYSFDIDGLDIAPDGSIVFADEKENRIVRLVFAGG